MLSAEESKVAALRHRFLACGLAERDTRERVLQDMPEEIRVRIPDGATPIIAVFNIVDRCMAYDDGIEQLALALRQVVGGIRLMDDLDALAREASRMPVSYARRQNLLHTASGMQWPQDVLRRAYQRSIPESVFPPVFSNESDTLLAQMVKDLTGRGHHATRFPLLEFVERLAVCALKEEYESVRDDLQEWVEGTAFELKLDDAYVSRMRARIGQEVKLARAEKVPYLLVMLATASATSEGNLPIEDRVYNVQAWLVDEVASYLSPQVALDDTPRKLEEVPQLLGSLIERYQDIEDLVDSINNLVIEFLVPDELLNYGFDTWQVWVDGREIDLGIEYHVVVRSAKRATNQRSWSAWRNKWTFLQNALKAQDASEDSVCICSPEGCKAHGDSTCSILFCSRIRSQEQKHLQAVLRRSPIVYLALAHADPEDGSTNGNSNSVLQTILHTGMPVALWPRKHMSRVDSIRSLLSYTALAALPQEVWKWRKNAVTDGDESTPGLSLLWDDPFRLPPTIMQWKGAPAIKKQL